MINKAKNLAFYIYYTQYADEWQWIVNSQIKQRFSRIVEVELQRNLNVQTYMKLYKCGSLESTLEGNK